ncbi:YhcH/YjgK/YiaL family protein [Paenibacillus oryzisoli]|uniref:YhcH/YjgK/YiaL family protein n=1 Tax=Paenibacillus oryzisoli TaxID=1850517 RepID=A0A198AB74_9BACL|nr:YhcH/YjgK/YiaL family protein [Paenibacillus oryzisoli]OAS18417.1 hypothetical protein A8708_00330 [Paenibacillus oryzisoli]
MILGTMSLWEKQSKFEHKVIVRALEELNLLLKGDAPEGRVEIQGDQMYVSFMEFDAKPMDEQLAEKHESYIDIHYLIDGEETIGWFADREEIRAVKAYESEHDYALYDPSAGEILLHLKPGMFAVFFPNDIHRPGMGQSSKIKKAVVKVHVGLLQP